MMEALPKPWARCPFCGRKPCGKGYIEKYRGEDLNCRNAACPSYLDLPIHPDRLKAEGLVTKSDLSAATLRAEKAEGELYRLEEELRIEKTLTDEPSKALCAERDTALAENARLREALNKIASSNFPRAHSDMFQEIAKQALDAGKVAKE